MQNYASLAGNTESPVGMQTVSRYVPRSNVIYKQMKEAIKALSVFDEHKRAIFYAEAGPYSGVEAERETRSLHAMLGILSEVEELLQAFLKFEQLDSINLMEELGDLEWYIALFCNANNIDFNTMLERNIEKLRQRYPKKFSVDKAHNRDLASEREVLEGASSLTPDEEAIGELENPYSDLPRCPLTNKEKETND